MLSAAVRGTEPALQPAWTAHMHMPAHVEVRAWAWQSLMSLSPQALVTEMIVAFAEQENRMHQLESKLQEKRSQLEMHTDLRKVRLCTMHVRACTGLRRKAPCAQRADTAAIDNMAKQAQQA